MLASAGGPAECPDLPSYTSYSWKRLKGVAMALLQTEQHVQQLKEEIENRLNSRRAVDALFCRVERRRTSLKQLNLFLQNQRNSVEASLNRLRDVSSSLEQKRALVHSLEVEIERDRVAHDEKLRDYIAHREQLVWVNAQLALRRKEMTNRVGEIFVVQRMATTSKPKCGCTPLYRIVGLHLPDAEKYIRHGHMEVSTALGHTAQLVSILSRIFNLPLRYPVRPFGSRSAVLDPYARSEAGPRAHLFPLFSRHQDKLLFEYGVFLLNKNIAQLRRSLGLPTPDLRCTLANVAMLLEHLTEVALESDAASSLRAPISPASSQSSWSTTGTRTSGSSRGVQSLYGHWSTRPCRTISVDRSSSLPVLFADVAAEACNGADGASTKELNNHAPTTTDAAPSSNDEEDRSVVQRCEGNILAACPDVLHWSSD
uniref:UV radiation resistance-associated gene protein n=1 Tax=Trichuris muris TaxID=70415 RepID=A0A5S6QSX4_TRIMR